MIMSPYKFCKDV